ncbi:MAG: hypothetical protein R3D31_01545 [Hyphomicrobiaceae bacterium]
MASIIRFRSGEVAERPVLHLSGDKLRLTLESLIHAAEAQGGVERFASAVKLKAEIFQDRLARGRAQRLELSDFEQLAATMATVRRRVARALDDLGWANVRTAIAGLLDGAEDTTTADVRQAAFCKVFPDGREHRFVRDLAAELLHNVYPEHYPLMQRWVWDNKANTGVLREIWHDPVAGSNVDHMVIDVADRYETFLVLREELSQFLSDNGVFRDMLWYVDLVVAKVYGDYINEQGGSYLRTDFASEADPLEHARRILGLDGASPRTGRSRFKTIDGTARAVAPTKQLN